MKNPEYAMQIFWANPFLRSVQKETYLFYLCALGHIHLRDERFDDQDDPFSGYKQRESAKIREQMRRASAITEEMEEEILEELIKKKIVKKTHSLITIDSNKSVKIMEKILKKKHFNFTLTNLMKVLW